MFDRAQSPGAEVLVIGVLARIDERSAIAEHDVNDAGELVGGSDGASWAKMGALAAIERSEQAFRRGRTMSTFSEDEAVFDAVLFNLQVIGEAIKKLPEEARQTLPGASGSAPARLRDLIAPHDFAIDPEIIWEVATEHVPPLLDGARKLRDRVDIDPGA